jgi:ribosomal protein L12E/L44/L45/RPP1/RPP2
MKKVFALVLAVAMLMSVALAEVSSPKFGVISVDPDTVTVGVDADSETAKQLVTDIEAVGMDEAFGLKK